MSYPYYGIVVGALYLLFVALRRIYAWFAAPAGGAAP
jgi:hypothetical protein